MKVYLSLLAGVLIGMAIMLIVGDRKEERKEYTEVCEIVTGTTTFAGYVVKKVNVYPCSTAVTMPPTQFQDVYIENNY